jgi:hypothetical protein
MKLFGATCLIALGLFGSAAVALDCVAGVHSSSYSIASGTREARFDEGLLSQPLLSRETAEQLLVPWVPSCGSLATSSVACMIDLGRSRVEVVQRECGANAEEPFRCCVRYELYELGVDDRNVPFRRQICGATIPRPPLVDFIGECSDEEFCLDPYGDAHPLAVGLLAREIVQKMADGQSAVAFLRDRFAVNGLAWDLVIIPIEDGQLCLSRVQIIWQGFLELADCGEGMTIHTAGSTVSGEAVGELDR